MNNMKFSENDFYEKLSELNIDGKIGLKYCGDLEFYIEVLNISFESYRERNVELSKYFENKDFHNYTILVHSIKSGMANIGAMKLSDMARELEDAGKNENHEYIMKNHQLFMHNYQQLMEGIGLILPSKEEASNYIKLEEQEISLEEWEIYVSRIKYCLEELDLDQAIEIVDMVSMYQLSYESRGLLEQTKYSLQHFNVEEAKRLVGQLELTHNIL